MPHNAIVIGSGPAGVHAARGLMDGGWNVTIIDGGHAAPSMLKGENPGHFEDIRREQDNQWTWFLGNDLSNIPLDGISGGHGGGMASGNRSYVTRDTDRLLPVHAQNAFFIQSLAQGGLGAAWGAACALFDRASLDAMGIPQRNFDESLANVIRNIGVSGRGHPDFQSPLPGDHHSRHILEQGPDASNGVRFIQPPSAVLTQPLGERLPNPLTDMDYYTDAGRSVYRPQWTLETLRSIGCTYDGGYVVEKVSDGTVEGRSITTGETKIWTSDATILAAGAMNTGRIMLRSTGMINRPIPMVIKPHDFVVCVDWKSLGTTGPRDRVSLCQLVGIDDTPGKDGLASACAQLYGYRSLMLFRLLSAIPLPTPRALPLLSLLTPSFVIVDLRYPGHRHDGNTISVNEAGILTLSGTSKRASDHATSLKRMQHALREKGLIPIKTVTAPIGSTSHYAGTIPVSDDPSDPLRCDENGRVHGFSRVWVADASLFRCLPPLPHTLMLMANAYRIGQAITRA